MARTRLSVATCNLYNLNLPGHAMYRDSDGWTDEQYARKIEWLAAALQRQPADVWGLQELWHSDALADAFAAAKLPHYLVVPPEHFGERIVCAGAVPEDWLVDEPRWIEHFPDGFHLEASGDDPQTPDIQLAIRAFSRPVLHMAVQPRAKGKPIHIYVCHLKSKRPTAVYREGWYDRDQHGKHAEGIGYALSTIRRTAEAAALRSLLVEQMKDSDTQVLVLGDLNNGVSGDTLNLLTGQPNYLSGWSKGGSDVDLYSVATLQNYRSERSVNYTHIFRQKLESLDHILVSQEFYDHSRHRRWGFKGMDIQNDHLYDDNHRDNGTTDHGIVRAHFEWRPVKKKK